MDEQHKTLLTSPSMPRYQSPETDEHNSYAQIIKVFPEIHQQFLEVLDDIPSSVHYPSGNKENEKIQQERNPGQEIKRDVKMEAALVF